MVGTPYYATEILVIILRRDNLQQLQSNPIAVPGVQSRFADYNTTLGHYTKCISNEPTVNRSGV